MAERWKEADPEATGRIRLWTPAERAERHRIFGALAEALALPTRQLNYGQAARHLGMDHGDLLSKMFHYGIPCPAIVRELTSAERDRIVEIQKAYGESPDQLATAVATFIREVWRWTAGSGGGKP